MRLYDHILDNDASDISAINQKGIVLAVLRRFREAELQFSSAIYLNGEIQALWYNKALSLRFQANNGKALNDINKAISLTSMSKDKGSKNKDFLLLKAIILFVVNGFYCAQ